MDLEISNNSTLANKGNNKFTHSRSKSTCLNGLVDVKKFFINLKYLGMHANFYLEQQVENAWAKNLKDRAGFTQR